MECGSGRSRANGLPQRRSASKADPKALGAKRKSDAASRRSAWARNHGTQAVQKPQEQMYCCEGDEQ